MIRRGIFAVGAEIAKTHELVGSRCFRILQTHFDFAIGENFQRIGVQACQEILAGCIRIGPAGEQMLLTETPRCATMIPEQKAGITS